MRIRGIELAENFDEDQEFQIRMGEENAWLSANEIKELIEHLNRMYYTFK
jgi:hypothetical protein